MEDGLVLATISVKVKSVAMCLNPCCNGRWSRTAISVGKNGDVNVLILVVMEDGLVQPVKSSYQVSLLCLNPCCNGRWSRTCSAWHH